MNILKLNYLFLFLFLLTNGFGQDIPIGTWRDHLKYTDGTSVTYGNEKVFCASSSAIFIYDTQDYSIEKLSVVNGLSDISISNIEYINSVQKILITYTNGNIDLINNENQINNIPFVKNSNIIGDKAINHIYVKNHLAYLSTGFGIVILDCVSNEIVDTYFIGENGGYLKVNAVTFDETNIYAATEEGVFYANKSSNNLADYNEWGLVSALGQYNYNQIVFYSNKLFTSFDSSIWGADTVYVNNSGNWEKFIQNGLNVKQLSVFGNKLLLIDNSNVSLYNQSLALEKNVYIYKGEFSLSPLDALYLENDFWIADNNKGLIRLKNNWSGEIIAPNGILSNSTFKMDVVNGKLVQVSGGYQAVGLGLNITDYPFNVWENHEWDKNVPKNVFDYKNNKARDFCCVAINPQNTNEIYFGTWDAGLYKFNNTTQENNYRAQNSPLDSTFFGTTRISAMSFDEDNNLWILSAYSNNPLSVKTPTGEWHNFSFPGLLKTSSYFTKIVVDNNGYKWISDPRENGILVFDDNQTPSEKSDDRVVYLNSTNTFNSNIFDANIPGDRIYALEKDNDGEIWIGTSEGVVTINSPSDVFNQNIFAQPIYIQQDGQTQLLLESEIVTAIAVDGANRKWLGTQNSGVYLMSEDGTEEIEHFTIDNSPLFSNNIYDINIEGKTGEVFIATEKGLISYKGTATESNSEFDNVFVYPNPVKPDYNGVIAIRGLTYDTDVRITDISGNMVFQTKSIGGQAVWNGKDLNGNRVKTGVYLVFSGTKDGELKNTSKILFIN